jgi:amino acid transporter
MGRAVGSASLLFTGVTRLPLAAAWDRIAPRWFTRLDPVHKTPVNSILFVAVLVVAFTFFSLLGVGDQESSQLLAATTVVHYAIAYSALFALPLVGSLRRKLPVWVRAVSVAGLLSSLVALGISVYPVVDVVSRAVFAAKIAGVVVVTNLLGVLLYRARTIVNE